jgi:hypothetical protein
MRSRQGYEAYRRRDEVLGQQEREIGGVLGRALESYPLSSVYQGRGLTVCAGLSLRAMV